MGFAVIRVAGRRTELDVELWRALIKTADFLRRARPKRGVNPFTREPILMPRTDSAEVIVDGELFGTFHWLEGRIQVDGEPEVLGPLACQVAQALGAVVEDEDGKRLKLPRAWTLERGVARARQSRRAELPAGRTVTVFEYPGTFDVWFNDTLQTSGRRWKTVARSFGLPLQSHAKKKTERYDHRLHTVNGRETEEVHRFRCAAGSVIPANVAKGTILSIGLAPLPPTSAPTRNKPRRSRNERRPRKTG